MIIDGKEMAEKIKQEIKETIENENLDVRLAVVLVGDNPASKVYVKNKKIACKRVGIKSLEVIMNENTTQQELENKLKELSDDESVDGILLQLPLPKHLNENNALKFINENKDVDGLTQGNMAKLYSGQSSIHPCTPEGVLILAKSVVSDLQGKHVVVVGRSVLVGKPTALLFLNENATVSVCHSKTKNLHKITSQADILVSAAGKIGLITKKHIKKGAVVIDVGITRDENGLNKGDVDFKSCFKKASHITPVPGGVGPMTIAILLKNTLSLARQRKK